MWTIYNLSLSQPPPRPNKCTLASYLFPSRVYNSPGSPPHCLCMSNQRNKVLHLVASRRPHPTRNLASKPQARSPGNLTTLAYILYSYPLLALSTNTPPPELIK